jgi:Fe-S cluster assembly protein SufD
MSASGTMNAGYLETLLAGQPHLPASPLAWLNALRAEAVDRVGVLTVPTQRDEEWRFTDISQLTKMSFHPVRTTISLQVADIERFYIEEATTRLVFVDGVYAPQLSSGITDNGVAVVNLEAGFAAHAAAIEPYLGRLTEFSDNVFAALNTAFLHDAALIVVPERHVSHALHRLDQLLGLAAEPEAAQVASVVIRDFPFELRADVDDRQPIHQEVG